MLQRLVAAELAQNHVEDRGQKNPEHRDTDHSREDGDAHGTPHLGASADRRDERHDAHDERHRRHQDRTKSQTACFDRRLHRIAPGQFKLARKLDDQNGVLR